MIVVAEEPCTYKGQRYLPGMKIEVEGEHGERMISARVAAPEGASKEPSSEVVERARRIFAQVDAVAEKKKSRK